MEPLKETVEADDLYGPFFYENQDLLAHLVRLGHDVGELAPSCAGLSLSMVDLGTTFTVVATDASAALLDAVQYTDDGPCQTSADTGEPIAHRTRGSGQGRWPAFDATAVAHGVASSLSLPVVVEETTVATFNLYGSEPDTFDGLHDRIAKILGAWAPGAITDADLSFGTMQLARRAPQVLADSTQLTVVATLLASSRDLSVREAEERLRAAAVRAAVPLQDLLRSMLVVLGVVPFEHTEDEDDDQDSH